MAKCLCLFSSVTKPLFENSFPNEIELQDGNKMSIEICEHDLSKTYGLESLNSKDILLVFVHIAGGRIASEEGKLSVLQNYTKHLNPIPYYCYLIFVDHKNPSSTKDDPEKPDPKAEMQKPEYSMFDLILNWKEDANLNFQTLMKLVQKNMKQSKQKPEKIAHNPINENKEQQISKPFNLLDFAPIIILILFMLFIPFIPDPLICSKGDLEIKRTCNLFELKQIYQQNNSSLTNCLNATFSNDPNQFKVCGANDSQAQKIKRERMVLPGNLNVTRKEIQGNFTEMGIQFLKQTRPPIDDEVVEIHYLMEMNRTVFEKKNEFNQSKINYETCLGVQDCIVRTSVTDEIKNFLFGRKET